MYAEVTCNTAAKSFNLKLKLKNYVKGEQRSFWQAAIYWSLCWVLHRCRHWGGEVFPPSQYFCLHNFSPASPARVRRSSRGSRWSLAPSSSPASSSRHPAKMLCRSEDKRIKCFKIAPKRPLGWLCQKSECFLSHWQYSFTIHFPSCPISFLHVPLFIGLKVSHQ